MKSAVVTGAESEVGQSVATALIRRAGFERLLLVCGPDAKTSDMEIKLRTSSSSSSSSSSIVLEFVVGDLSNEETIERICSIVRDKFGGTLTALVHNVASPSVGDAASAAAAAAESGCEEKIKEYERFQDLGPRSFLRLIEATLQFFQTSPPSPPQQQQHPQPLNSSRRAPAGYILATLDSGCNSNPKTMIPDACGAVVQYLTRHYAKVLAARGIVVNCLLLGGIRRIVSSNGDAAAASAAATDSLAAAPAPRLGEPEEVGAVAGFLCGESASFLTGAAIPVDGGLGIR